MRSRKDICEGSIQFSKVIWNVFSENLTMKSPLKKLFTWRELGKRNVTFLLSLMSISCQEKLKFSHSHFRRYNQCMIIFWEQYYLAFNWHQALYKKLNSAFVEWIVDFCDYCFTWHAYVHVVVEVGSNRFFIVLISAFVGMNQFCSIIRQCNTQYWLPIFQQSKLTSLFSFFTINDIIHLPNRRWFSKSFKEIMHVWGLKEC